MVVLFSIVLEIIEKKCRIIFGELVCVKMSNFKLTKNLFFLVTRYFIKKKTIFYTFSLKKTQFLFKNNLSCLTLRTYIL